MTYGNTKTFHNHLHGSKVKLNKTNDLEKEINRLSVLEPLRLAALIKTSEHADKFIEIMKTVNATNPRHILYHATNGNDIPKCKCGQTLDWFGDNRCYRTYCSVKCKSIDLAVKIKENNLATFGVASHLQLPEMKQKIKETNLSRYGVENPSQNAEIREKQLATNVARYGVKHPLQNPDILQKMKGTNLEKYGVEWTQQNTEVKNKSKETMIKKYGVSNPHQVPEFFQKARDTCMKNLGVNYPAQSDIIKDRMIQTHLAEYGVEWPMQSIEIQDKRMQNNLKKYGVEHITQRNYSSETIELLNGKSPLLPQLDELLQTTRILEISNTYNISTTVLYNIAIERQIQLPKFNISGFEKEVFDYVKSIYDYDGNIVCSDRTILQGKEIDIYLPDINLAIECNGAYWHSEMVGKDKNYHNNKTNDCRKVNITLFHVWDYDWDTKKDIIKSMIAHKLEKSQTIFARKTKVILIENSTANDFYNVNHLQGKTLGISVSYGLIYDGELVSVMSLGKSRFNKNYDWEILRFASKNNNGVVGGASKLFSAFMKEHQPNNVISYADRMHSFGNVYTKLGFERVGFSPPAYQYTNNFKDFHNRQKFQKHKLPKLLKEFNPSLTEWQNMQNNGYTKIWNSGNDIFVWSK